MSGRRGRACRLVCWTHAARRGDRRGRVQLEALAPAVRRGWLPDQPGLPPEQTLLPIARTRAPRRRIGTRRGADIGLRDAPPPPDRATMSRPHRRLEGAAVARPGERRGPSKKRESQGGADISPPRRRADPVGQSSRRTYCRPAGAVPFDRNKQRYSWPGGGEGLVAHDQLESRGKHQFLEARRGAGRATRRASCSPSLERARHMWAPDVSVWAARAHRRADTRRREPTDSKDRQWQRPRRGQSGHASHRRFGRTPRVRGWQRRTGAPRPRARRQPRISPGPLRGRPRMWRARHATRAAGPQSSELVRAGRAADEVAAQPARSECSTAIGLEPPGYSGELSCSRTVWYTCRSAGATGYR